LVSSSDGASEPVDYSEGGPVSSEVDSPGRSGPRREASAIREGRRPGGEAREGGTHGGCVRRSGSRGRFRRADARRALGRWAEGQVSVARRAFPRGRCLGDAGDRDAGTGGRDSGSSERRSGAGMGSAADKPRTRRPSGRRDAGRTFGKPLWAMRPAAPLRAILTRDRGVLLERRVLPGTGARDEVGC
jgi:hypothetical protein